MVSTNALGSSTVWTGLELGVGVGAPVLARVALQGVIGRLPLLRVASTAAGLAASGAAAYFRPSSISENPDFLINEKIFNALEVVGLGLLGFARPGFIGWACMGAGAYGFARAKWVEGHQTSDALISAGTAMIISGAFFTGGWALGRLVMQRLPISSFYTKKSSTPFDLKIFGDLTREVREGVVVYSLAPQKSIPNPKTIILWGGAYCRGPSSLGRLPLELAQEGHHVKIPTFAGYDALPGNLDAFKGGGLRASVMVDVWDEGSRRVTQSLVQESMEAGRPVVLGGFSQGAMGALQGFVDLPRKLREQVSGLVFHAPAVMTKGFDSKNPVKTFIVYDVLAPLLRLRGKPIKSTTPTRSELLHHKIMERPVALPEAVLLYCRQVRQHYLPRFAKMADEPKVYVGLGGKDTTVKTEGVDMLRRVVASRLINKTYPNTSHDLLFSPDDSLNTPVIRDTIDFIAGL